MPRAGSSTVTTVVGIVVVDESRCATVAVYLWSTVITVIVAVLLRCGWPTVTPVIIVSTGTVIDDSRRAVTVTVIAGCRCVVTVTVMVVSRRDVTVTVIVVSGDDTVSWSAAFLTVAVLVT
jgi:precorrin-4 methylase